MTDQWWVDLRQRVEAAGAVPAGRAVFGALGHEWLVEDPLTAQEVEELEAQIGVRLPEEYRAFLVHVGAGGAGPAYGLFPVRRVHGRWYWDGDGAEPADLSRLAEPFPDRGPDPELLDDLLSQRPEEEDLDDLEDYDDAMEAWDARWEAVMFAPERTVGAIAISHLGCAQREWLVISGRHRGTIWSDRRADDIDLLPLLEHDTPVTFARWYTAWLSDAERAAASAP
ncbi:SMI1/KNR4 family protein [Streptomyces sp. NPDC006733]|uniref:SMI1/KNR4 family protein n=1 Tax=Streptomyces sp. NPDC006733 TaxID=3155460 RepID=UPI0033EE3F30